MKTCGFYRSCSWPISYEVCSKVTRAEAASLLFFTSPGQEGLFLATGKGIV